MRECALEDELFLILLRWFMVSDPWPLPMDQHDAMMFLLNSEAMNRGFRDWVHAYHEWGFVR